MIIPLQHLKDGVHDFSEVLAPGTLSFQRQEIYPDPLEVTARVHRDGDSLRCKVSLKTTAHYTCDRCLDPLARPYAERFELLVHLGEETWDSTDDEVVELPADADQLDLTDHIIEHLILTVPMKVVFTDRESDRCTICGRDGAVRVFGESGEKSEAKEPPVDPRWAGLQSLRRPEENNGSGTEES